MAQGLIMAGIMTPIIKEVVFSGITTPEAVPDIGFNEQNFFTAGVSVGNSYSDHDTALTSCGMTDGILDIHNGYYLGFMYTETHDLSYETYGHVVEIETTDGTNIVSLPGFITSEGYANTVVAPVNKSPLTYETTEVHACIVKFSFPDATNPEERIPGYYYYIIQHRVVEDSDHVIYTDTYTTQRFLFNFAFANYYNPNLHIYLDPIEIPDHTDPFTPSEDNEYPDTPPTPDSSDTINIPGNPPIGVTGAGFINVYNPPMNALQGLGDILFPQFSTPTDIINAIEQLYNVIANQNLINYVIDCHVIPVTPQIGNNANIKVGYRDSGISVPKVTSDYIDATCGSLSIPEFFHGFQDYLATNSKIYLPFIGFVDTKPEYWQAGTISVDYKFNVIDGSFMCYIRSVSSKSALNGSVIAQYSGNACMHFPLTGVNYANMVSGIVGTAAGVINKGGATSAILGGAWSAANTIAKGGDIQQSNGYNSTAALLGVREAFLLIERPVPAYPAGYGHNKGFPSNITTELSNVTGYTEITDIDLSGIPLTQAELDELRELLKEGVYF